MKQWKDEPLKVSEHIYSVEGCQTHLFIGRMIAIE